MEGYNAWQKNAWGAKKEEVEEPIVSFVDIMSEDLAKEMAEEEERMGMEDRVGGEYGSPCTSYRDDEEMARALQREFDREYDLSVRLEQSKSQGNKTVSVTQDRYCPKNKQWDSNESDDSDDAREEETTALYAKLEKDEVMPTGGCARTEDGTWVTKHDSGIMSSRNIDKVMNAVDGIPTGDLITVSDVHNSNQVFNKLRSFNKAEQRRIHRLKDKEEKATIETSVDAVTRLLLFKWINAGLFDRIDGIVATGKESAVLSAAAAQLIDGACASAIDASPDQPYFLAIKVYKTSLIEFKNRSEYVQNDFRFKNPRRVMRIWAEKEFMNLTRMFNQGLPCPEPIKLKKHVMVMGFIGQNGIAAPKMKDVQFVSDEEKIGSFQQTLQIVNRMYKDCKLVHGDLSEFNLLVQDGQVYVIDVSQAMDLSHPRVLFYLLRDIDNVLNFFHRIGTENLPRRVDVFNEVTGLDMDDQSDLLTQVESFEGENRNTQLRIDKAKPADRELRMYLVEKGKREPSLFE